MSLPHACRTLASRAATSRTTTILTTTTRAYPTMLCSSSALRCFSTSSSSRGIFGSLRDKWDDRQKQAQEEKFHKQLEQMSTSEKWTISDFNAELKETLGSWRNKIPGMSSMKQIKIAKQTQKVMEAVMEQVGPDATAQDVQELKGKEKRIISLKSGASMQEINLMLKQFEGMDMMQQVLRRRKLEGKPLPTDEAGMRAAMQQDMPKVLSKKQKKDVIARQKQSRRRGF